MAEWQNGTHLEHSPLEMLGIALAAVFARRFRGRLGAICPPASRQACQGRHEAALWEISLAARPTECSQTNKHIGIL